jgi:hypothetical protein
MRKEKRKYPNAYKHGAFADIAIAPGEDLREFAELERDLIEEWLPNGPTELDAVRSIAKAIWRKRRVQQFLRAQLAKNSIDISHPSFDDELALQVFSLSVKKDPETAFSKRADQCLRPDKRNHLKMTCPRANFKTAAEWGDAIINEIDTVLLPSLKTGFPEGDRLVASILAAPTLSGDSFKQEVALEERLDAIIERAIRRLIQMKTMKQVLFDAPVDLSARKSNDVCEEIQPEQKSH